MHQHYEKAHKWTKEAINAAQEVHSIKGPGLLEPIYEKCMDSKTFAILCDLPVKFFLLAAMLR